MSTEPKRLTAEELADSMDGTYMGQLVAHDAVMGHIRALEAALAALKDGACPECLALPGHEHKADCPIMAANYARSSDTQPAPTPSRLEIAHEVLKCMIVSHPMMDAFMLAKNTWEITDALLAADSEVR
jgi:hypothetical protein